MAATNFYLCEFSKDLSSIVLSCLGLYLLFLALSYLSTCKVRCF